MLEVRRHRWSMKQLLIFELQPCLLLCFQFKPVCSDSVLNGVFAQFFNLTQAFTGCRKFRSLFGLDRLAPSDKSVYRVFATQSLLDLA